MGQTAKIVVVSQHYPPDQSTTAAIMAVIADHLVAQAPVLVVSGTPGSASHEATGKDRPVVVEVKNRIPAKAALIRRGAAEALFTLRVFVALLSQLRRGDVALTVPAPFMLPYAVAAAARLKRARSALIMHDLYPDVLVMAGLLRTVVCSCQGDPWRQRADVSRVECRHHHRAGYRTAAVALQGRHIRQDPVYSQLGHAGAGGAADSARQSLSPPARGALFGWTFRQSRLYARS